MASEWQNALERWVAAELIDPATAAAIEGWEAAQQRPRLRTPILVCPALGAVLQLNSALATLPGQASGLAPSTLMEVELVAHRGRLEAIRARPGEAWNHQRHAWIERIDEAAVARLKDPVAFFIPPDVHDPSRRPGDEELWVE